MFRILEIEHLKFIFKLLLNYLNNYLINIHYNKKVNLLKVYRLNFQGKTQIDQSKQSLQILLKQFRFRVNGFLENIQIF